MESTNIEIGRVNESAKEKVQADSDAQNANNSEQSESGGRPKKMRQIINHGLEPAIKDTVFARTVVGVIRKQQQEKESSNAYVLHPYSYIRIALEWIILTLSIVTLTALPVGVAFYENNEYYHWIISNLVFDTFFIGDIFVNFLTGYEDHVNFTIVMDRREVAINYLRRWFVLDIVSSLPFDIVYYSASQLSGTLTHARINISKCLSLMRILRLVRLCRYAIKLESFMEYAAIYLNILNLLVIIFLVAHWVACIQFLVVSAQNYPNGSWVDLSHIKEAPVFVQYTHAMFKSLSQLISVGYGTITPIETSDVMITMLTCTLGSFFYATFIGFLGSIITSINSRRAEFTHKLAGVRDFLEYKNVPQDLEQKIIKYYKRCYPSHFFNETEILRELSPSLRKELLLATYKPLVNTVPFLANLRTSILYKIVQHLKHEIYMAGDYILEEGMESPGIFFVYRGMVDVLDFECRFIKRMRNGFYFGDISILIDKPNCTNVVARETTEVYMLPRSDFKAIVHRYPESFRKLYEDARVRHKILQAAIRNAARVFNQSVRSRDEASESTKESKP